MLPAFIAEDIGRASSKGPARGPKHITQGLIDLLRTRALTSQNKRKMAHCDTASSGDFGQRLPTNQQNGFAA